MSKDYTINNVQRGNEWQFNGKEMVSYALGLDGVQGFVKLNQVLETTPPKVGDTVHGEVETKQDRHGNDYLKFTKVNPKFANQTSGAGSDKIEYIVKMLEELTGRRAPEDLPLTPPDFGSNPLDNL